MKSQLISFQELNTDSTDLTAQTLRLFCWESNDRIMQSDRIMVSFTTVESLVF